MAYIGTDNKRYDSYEAMVAAEKSKGTAYGQAPAPDLASNQIPVTYGQQGNPNLPSRNEPVFNPNTGRYENRNASGQLISDPGVGKWVTKPGTNQEVFVEGDYAWSDKQGKYILKSEMTPEDSAFNSSTGFRSYIDQTGADIGNANTSADDELAFLEQYGKGQEQKILDDEMLRINAKANEDRDYAAQQNQLDRESADLPDRLAKQNQNVGITTAQLNRQVASKNREITRQKMELSQNREMTLLARQRADLLKQAQEAFDEQNYKMAQWAFEQSQSIRKEMAAQEAQWRKDAIQAEKDEQTRLDKEAKAARDAFEFAMDNGINKPYYTLDGYTYWNATTGQMADPSEIGSIEDVQIIDPTAKVDTFETRTVDKQIIRFGFDSQGNIVSKTVLGKATTSSGSSGSSSTGMTTSEKKKYNELVDRIKSGADPETTLDKATGSVYTNLKDFIESYAADREQAETERAEQAQSSRLDEYASSDDIVQQSAAILYLVKSGKEEGDFATEYVKVLKDLAALTARTGKTRTWYKSMLNRAIEYIETGKTY